MSTDILFATLEKYHGSRLWGRFLDAGTGMKYSIYYVVKLNRTFQGLHSIKWVQSLPSCTSWTAVTADQGMCNQIQRDVDIMSRIRQSDSIIIGNWMDDNFCSQLGSFDTILADYLIGAVDGFSPYEQDTIINRYFRLYVLVNSNDNHIFSHRVD